jgi:hypothetical protein
MRKLTKQTIKPVLSFIKGWSSDIHSFNTLGADFYEFTLDTYNGKNSFSGGFSWGLDGCYNYNNEPNEQYAINLKTKEVYDLDTKQIIMQV